MYVTYEWFVCVLFESVGLVRREGKGGLGRFEGEGAV